MKVTLINGVVTVTSQTKREAYALVSFALSSGNIPEKGTKERKHKRHLFVKACPYCGKKCRGNAALAMHTKSCPHKMRQILSSSGQVV